MSARSSPRSIARSKTVSVPARRYWTNSSCTAASSGFRIPSATIMRTLQPSVWSCVISTRLCMQRVQVAGERARVRSGLALFGDVVHRGGHELELRLEPAVDRRLADAGARRDRVDAHALEATLAVLLERGEQDRAVALRCCAGRPGLPGLDRCASSDGLGLEHGGRLRVRAGGSAARSSGAHARAATGRR